MAPPKKYLTLEAKQQSIRDKSKHYYERYAITKPKHISFIIVRRHKHEIHRRRAAYYDARHGKKSRRSESHSGARKRSHVKRVGKTNALEIQTISRATVHYPKSMKVKLASPPLPPPPPPADVFPKLSDEAKVLWDDFDYFIGDMSLTSFIKHLLKKYFRSDSKRQGQIAVFVEPLDELYRFQKSYGCIVAQSLRIEGPSARHLALEQEGQSIGRAVKRLRCA
ncbi:uncharacterized protein ARMOST_19299 [Armillaria ostoyae]|uniref:Uncharacterized protein n=1 Tax=Armillaria ostoyae TaxID=47428 RepID=A0A284S457_ARMOS|nr:uncharacterized protein ARMOST_19299 [Armillaria ostoyae]